MEKKLEGHDYQRIEEAIEELFDSEPGSEEAEKLRELVQLVKKQSINPRHHHSGKARSTGNHRIP